MGKRKNKNKRQRQRQRQRQQKNAQTESSQCATDESSWDIIIQNEIDKIKIKKSIWNYISSVYDREWFMNSKSSSEERKLGTMYS